MGLKEMYYNLSIVFLLLASSSAFTQDNNLGITQTQDNNKITLTIQIQKPNSHEGIRGATILGNGISNSVEVCQHLVGVSKGDYCPITETKVTNLNIPGSCQEIYRNGKTISGTYEILPTGQTKPVTVLCDMEIEGGGWTIIQKRFDGSVDFYRPWRDYKFGFGNLKGEFWLGLENIHHLTSSKSNELLIEVTDHNLLNYYARYPVFEIGSEYQGYKLKTLGSYSGNSSGDSMIYHLSQRFTTFDQDQDSWSEGNCAKFSHGGWWYNNCYSSNLNGSPRNIPHISPKDTSKRYGMNWDKITTPSQSHLYGTRMLIRPKL
ncbi:microfibril-associated glycoprotein 4-like isoform X1 [Diabrotica virgifera virgifera]|uniref:Microfibril-associated glycoprotein 4-like isoform X1 n=1 Tax=Diabrotica virgifera virgifera TaxID=50390 RepID=A0A6P7GKN6_DIAVI|nr:microfibril-associated glycoprotein 4-like isoform X1 [Diabrotica virgifera virgifera]